MKRNVEVRTPHGVWAEVKLLRRRRRRRRPLAAAVVVAAAVSIRSHQMEEAAAEGVPRVGGAAARARLSHTYHTLL